jgi:hypothetical protein
MRKMNMQSEELLQEWYDRIVKVQNAHYATASTFNRLHYWFGISAVVMSTFVGTSVFLFSTFGEYLPIGIAFPVGLASMVAALLTAIQTFTRYGEFSERHHWAGARYEAFKREIEQKKVFMSQTPEEFEAYITNLRSRWDAVAEECPVIPQRIWNQFDEQTTP